MKGAKANLGILGFGTLVFIFFSQFQLFLFLNFFYLNFLTYYKVFFFYIYVCVCVPELLWEALN